MWKREDHRVFDEVDAQRNSYLEMKPSFSFWAAFLTAWDHIFWRHRRSFFACFEKEVCAAFYLFSSSFLLSVNERMGHGCWATWTGAKAIFFLRHKLASREQKLNQPSSLPFYSLLAHVENSISRVYPSIQPIFLFSFFLLRPGMGCCHNNNNSACSARLAAGCVVLFLFLSLVSALL